MGKRRNVVMGVVATGMALGLAAPAIAGPTPAAENRYKGACNTDWNRDRASRSDAISQSNWWLYAGRTTGASSDQMYAYAEVRPESTNRTVAVSVLWPYNSTIAGKEFGGVDTTVTAGPSGAEHCLHNPAPLRNLP